MEGQYTWQQIVGMQIVFFFIFLLIGFFIDFYESRTNKLK